MEDLGPKFERATGHKLAITFATLGAVVKRVQDGETADVVVIPQQGIDTLVKDGKAPAGNVTVLARSGIVVAIRKGAPKARYLVARRLETHAARREVDRLCRSSERRRERHPFRQGARSLGDRQRDAIEDGLPQPQNPRRGWRLGCKRRGRDRRAPQSRN
jgi:ABC-type molybdate transport system, periplasmic component